MRERPSSRLLLIDPAGRVLLFKFEHKDGPLRSQTFWATPGGGLDPGETYEDAASRECLEETGLAITHPGPQVAQRTAIFQLPDGDWTTADERFFIIRVDGLTVSAEGWTELERKTMTAHHWWSVDELKTTTEQIWPENLIDILIENRTENFARSAS